MASLTWTEYATWVQGRIVLRSSDKEIYFTDGSRASFYSSVVTPGCETCGSGTEIVIEIEVTG